MIVNGRLFPVWQVDEREYEAVCAYLHLEPQPRLFEFLSGYLSGAPFRFSRPTGFALFLAGPRVTRFRLARLDLATKLFYPEHPVRHILNGVIALHECDGTSYRQMERAPAGVGAWLWMVAWGAVFLVSTVITLGWLAVQLVWYVVVRGLRPAQDLAGRCILITGANRGLGRELMLYALQQGASVVGTVRTSEARKELVDLLPPAAPIQLLVADLVGPGALAGALEDAQVPAESIDVAVLCAGTKAAGSSVLSLETVRDTFEVNCFSAIDFAGWFYAARNTGTLVLVSSMGRWHGMHSSGGYNASKAALSIWGESLEQELSIAGNGAGRITIVEPGMFESGMVEAKGIRKFLLASPRELAERILASAIGGKKGLRFPFWFALLTWAVCLGGRHFRTRLFTRVKR